MAPVPQRARRKRKGEEFHSEVARAKIQASMIIERMQKHFKGELELSMTQIRVGEILLRKCVPDLVQTDILAQITHRYVIEAPAQLTRDQWEQKYSLPAPGSPLKQITQ